MINEIKKNWLAARKATIKNKVFATKSNLLGTLIGEIEMLAKNDGQREVTDADCIVKIKAFIKAIDQILEAYGNDHSSKVIDIETSPLVKAKLERQILEDFLPKQMSEQALAVAIVLIIMEIKSINSIPDMGKVMNILKSKYAGLYDGKLASTLVKEALTNG
jgi:hypothetical protein